MAKTNLNGYLKMTLVIIAIFGAFAGIVAGWTEMQTMKEEGSALAKQNRECIIELKTRQEVIIWNQEKMDKKLDKILERSQ